MLILSRRLNESIVIANHIVVSVLEIRHDQVRIGIQAPQEVKVYRQELYLAIQEENRAAARSAHTLPPLPQLPAEEDNSASIKRK